MKRFCQLLTLLLLLLTACSGDGSGLNCKEGICIHLTIERPIKSQKPAKFTVFLKTNEDISDLVVSIYGGTSTKIQNPGKLPEGTEIVYQDERSIDWHIDTKAGKEYIFTGQVIFPKPTVSYGIFYYDLFAAANHPARARAVDSVVFYLDMDGNEVDAAKAKSAEYPLPTVPPDQIVITEKPFPTITPVILPTETPEPTITVPAYPGP